MLKRLTKDSKEQFLLHFVFQVHKFMIAPKDFSLPGGELTPTMKVKRHFVMELYKKKIDQMYEHETQSSMW